MLGMLAGAVLRSLLLAAAVGAALWLRRTHNPRVSFAAWTLVLAASLSMPVATQLASLALPHGMIQIATLPLGQEFMAQTHIASVMSRAGESVSAALPMVRYWYWLVLSFYLAVFGALMLRLLVALSLSWRVVRSARPISEDWGGDFDVRVSRNIDAPATFGSVILLPSDYTAWTTAKQLAVLAHEGSHVARCDFAVQLVAAVNRTVFWFNPFNWWLQRHLSDLAEAASDDAAIARLDDRFGYAEILLEISGRIPRLPGAVAMARRSAVTLRIERILSEAPLSASMSQCSHAMMVASTVPLTILLSSISVSPPLLETQPSPAAKIADDGGAMTGLKQSAPAYSLAVMMPQMALLPPISIETVPAAMPAGLPAAPDPEAQTSPQTPAPPPARLSTPPSQLSAQRRLSLASHSMRLRNAAKSTSHQAVQSANTPPQSILAQDPSLNRTEDSQPLSFEKLVNATCEATAVSGLGPAYLIPREGPAYLVQAHFLRSRDGKPWVTLYYTGTQKANLPVVIKGSEISFSRSSDMNYTLRPSRNDHFVSFAKYPAGEAADFSCRGGNTRPS